jgi:monofunctional glycosyltransferase
MARRWLRVLVSIAEIGSVLAAIPALVLWCSVPATANLATENPSTTAFIELRRQQADDAGKRFQLHWDWRRVGKISRYLRAAVVYSEDIHFYTHDGVDWHAFGDAISKDFAGAKIGGSTITQQLAKNLYLSPSRSMWRKAREMLIAFSLEDHLSKTRLLELYLNVVEWGDGVFGAEAASRRWFGHSAQQLSPVEAAKLATALPNPITRAPNVHTAELTQKRIRIINLLRMQGLLDGAQYAEALGELGAKVPAKPLEVPTPPVEPEPAKPDNPTTTPTQAQDPPPSDQPVTSPGSSSE